MQKRITILQMLSSPLTLQLIEWGCWNMLGIGRWQRAWRDLETGDLVFEVEREVKGV